MTHKLNRDAKIDGLTRGVPTSSRRIAVIGAGPSGLACIKEISEAGFDVVGFEALPTLGGVFASHYERLQLVSNSILTSFGAYSDGQEHAPKMWTRDEYLEYLTAYTQHFSLFKRIHFSTRVDSLQRNPNGSGFRLRVAPVDPSSVHPHYDKPQPDVLRRPILSRGPVAAHGEDVEFDHVAICSGVHLAPKTPEWPGRERFRGKIEHSRSYWNPDDYKDKRVLIVGLGESGSDLALQVARVAKSSAISTRKGPGFVIPRYQGGRPSDLDTNRVYHAIPRALSGSRIVRFKTHIEALFLGPDDDRHVIAKADAINKKRGRSPFHRFGTKNTSFIEALLYHGTSLRPDIERLEEDRVVFVDGTSFECDVIICCTGYQIQFPFFSEHEPKLAQRASNARNLYKHMINPQLGLDIAWIGFVRPAVGAIPPLAELQARYYALLLAGERTLPSIAAMERDIAHHAQLDMSQYPDDAGRIAALTDFLRFMDSIAKEIGCNPPLDQLLFSDPKTWLKVLFAPLSGAQYRLEGPSAEPERIRSVLARMPMMPWPVLAYELLCVLGSKALHEFGFGDEFKPIGLNLQEVAPVVEPGH